MMSVADWSPEKSSKNTAYIDGWLDAAATAAAQSNDKSTPYLEMLTKLDALSDYPHAASFSVGLACKPSVKPQTVPILKEGFARVTSPRSIILLSRPYVGGKCVRGEILAHHWGDISRMRRHAGADGASLWPSTCCELVRRAYGTYEAQSCLCFHIMRASTLSTTIPVSKHIGHHGSPYTDVIEPTHRTCAPRLAHKAMYTQGKVIALVLVHMSTRVKAGN